MSLLTYDDARPYAKAIRDEVTEGHMPPWHADAPAGTFENERKLTGEEKHTVPAEVEFLQDTIVYGLFPHTHLRGKAWDYKLVLPDGTSKSILAEDNPNSKAE